MTPKVSCLNFWGFSLIAYTCNIVFQPFTPFTNYHQVNDLPTIQVKW